MAIATLGHLLVDPCLLHGVQAIVALADTLDRGDLLAFSGLNRRDAGTDRRAIEVYRAGAALGDATAELRARQAGLFANRPEQRCIGLDIQFVCLAVDVQSNHSADMLCVNTPYAGVG